MVVSDWEIANGIQQDITMDLMPARIEISIEYKH
jgi:hypothetical protein